MNSFLFIAIALLFVSEVSYAAGTAPPAFCPEKVTASMKLVNHFWQAKHPSPTKGSDSLTWGNGTYYSGNLAAYKVLNISSYLTYAKDWASTNHYTVDPHHTNPADFLCVGYDFIVLYNIGRNRPVSDIESIHSRISDIMKNPENNILTYIDALHMALPQFAQLGVIKKNSAYFSKMYDLFHYTKALDNGTGLWNPSKGLWWRDNTFVGTNVYWSRGNGWVFAALVKILESLPVTDSRRSEYIQIIQQMAAALKIAQQPDGFWYVNLGNPADYPGPETSGTLFFVFGLVWGINNQILDSATYGPVAAKAWNAVVNTALQPSGLLGYVQSQGTGPADGQPVTANSTFDYAVGGFLLAGSELVKLCGS